jgi:hypothetical protein
MAATKWTVQQIPSQTGKTALVTGANSGTYLSPIASWQLRTFPTRLRKQRRRAVASNYGGQSVIGFARHGDGVAC